MAAGIVKRHNKVTFDLYGHLMPGSEREAARMLDVFLERAASQARTAAVI